MQCDVFHRGELCDILELRGVCGDAGSGLRGLDRLSWDEAPWKRERVSRRSPNCKLLGLCCLSGGVWNKSRQRFLGNRSGKTDLILKSRLNFTELDDARPKLLNNYIIFRIPKRFSA